MVTRSRYWGIAATVLLAACSGEKGADGAPGDDGQDGAGYIALEPAGVVGLVTDPGGEAVGDGTIYFVPAGDVAAMGATTTAVDSDTDEPLEDLIRLNGTSYTSTTVGTDGVYRLTTLPEGSYYVTYVPAGTDYLPGGSLCRVARASTALVNTRLDIEVSASIPAGAEYVGSSKCIGCHGRAHISGTMHRLGIWSAYEVGPLQDLDARRADLYKAFETKFDPAGGTTVYFYGYDSSRGFDKYKTSETAPVDPAPPAAWTADTAYAVGDKVSNAGGEYEAITAGTSASSGGPAGTSKNITDDTVHWKFINTGTSFMVNVHKNGTDFEMTITNLQGGGGTDTRKVDAVYGGGVNKQRYLHKFVNGSDFYYSTLPLQFNQEGSEDANRDRTSKVWRDYHGDYWYDEGAQVLTEPHDTKSFAKNCMSCHAVGVKIDPATFKAETVKDALYGDFDFDGDGIKEEMNVGCETCHGPGSAHWEAAGQGKHIVSLKLLTPEREAMVCGQCHSRPTGRFDTDSPVNAQGWMMIAGASRNDFLQNHVGGSTGTGKLDASGGDLWGDAADDTSLGDHSKKHHQQYTDFIRSKLYKNANELMTCSSCHDPHKKTEFARQLRKDPNDNAQLCGQCHGVTTENNQANLTAHLTEKQVYVGTHPSVAKCVDCHMPKTAQTGAGFPRFQGSVSGTVYQWKDVSSHLFDAPLKQVSIDTKMPTAYTNPCATCHSGNGM